MPTINPTTPAVPAGASQAAKDKAKFGEDFNSFLTLLTTQLKYQDPTSPMDSTQFTQQLVQFTSVEQQVKQNVNLEAMLAAQQTMQVASAANYIGKTVEAGGTSVVLRDGQAPIEYSLDRLAREVSIVIKDSAGTEVRKLVGNTGSGSQRITWDGRTNGGTRVPDGTYSFTVTANDTNGQKMTPQTGVTAKIDAFEVAGSTIILRAADRRIPITDVNVVR
ncbi:MAG: flagellar hook assembly protein FlgD [Alphaproteobacteria bacterium]|jgi:flagellar basal-body rod modification protein FlgD